MSTDKKEETLLVPIELEAAVVSADREEVVDMSPKFDFFGRDLPFLRLGCTLKSEPWQSKTILERGVHLHWALPAALTHGIQPPGGDIEFPLVPNRWLVLRASATSADKVKAWVLHSDYLLDEHPKNFLFKDKDGTYITRKIGLSRELNNSSGTPGAPNTASVTNLTPVAPGNPAFAAYYPGCRNVFGFHDELKDLDTKDNNKLLYFVAGWYGDPQKDPLKLNKPEWQEHFRKSWPRLTPKPSKPQEVFTRILCHGALHSVETTPAARSRGPIQISIGNTAIEALSTLLSKTIQLQDVSQSDTGLRADNLEPLLSALQYDILGNIDPLNGLPELDAEMHRRRFYPVDGGTRWLVKPVERARATPASGTEPPLPFPVDKNVASTFDKVCRFQRAVDRHGRKLVSLREQYYAAWVQSKLDNLPDELPKPDLEVLKREINIANNSLRQANSNLNQYRIDLSIFGIQVNNTNAESRWELVASPEPRFWRCSDPAILVAIPDSKPNRYGDRDQPLTCRAASEVLTALPPDGIKPGISDLAGLESTTLPFPDEVKPLYLELVKALYLESTLFDPNRAKQMACKHKGLPDGRDQPDVNNLSEEIQTAQKATKYRGLSEWSPEGSPIFLVWELKWRPSYGEPENWKENWQLKVDSEYHRTGELDQKESTSDHVYHGWAPLSLNVYEQLKKRLGSAAGADAYKGWAFLTQCSNGFTNMLIQQEETLQLPPLNEDFREDQLTSELTRGESGEGKYASQPLRWSPLVIDSKKPSFYPIRAGHISIDRLLLVDAFGRFEDLADHISQTHVSESLCGSKPAGPWVALPPRIVQPSRLECSWVSVTDEKEKAYKRSNSNPATSPIFGWVVPNYFDYTLLVCDPIGRIRGELRETTGVGLGLHKLPGMAETVKDLAEDSDAYQLRDFIQGLMVVGPTALNSLLHLIDQISQCITTPAGRRLQGIGLILGQPLALVRASLAIETWGPMASYPPWAISSSATAGAFQNVRFPVQVGDARRSNNGLVGCFFPKAEGERRQTDYQKMRVAYHAPPQDSSHYLVFDEAVDVGLQVADPEVPEVTVGEQTQFPLTLTLLMDPRGGVHFTSGIQPVQFLELPEALVAEAMENIELSFRVGPVLSRDKAVRLPLPDGVAGSWCWSFCDAGGKAWRHDDGVGKPASASGVPDSAVRVTDGWLTLQRTKK